MRPTQSLKLPQSGLTAHFITYWSWGEKQEITKTVLGDTTIDPQSQAMDGVKLANGIDLNRKTLELAVKRLVDDEGNETPVSELFDLPESDVELLFDAIKKLDEAQKKN